MKASELQTQFFKEKGVEPFNSNGEPSVSYVEWLQDKIKSEKNILLRFIEWYNNNRAQYEIPEPMDVDEFIKDNTKAIDEATDRESDPA